MKLIQLTGVTRLLDVGCGEGFVMDYFRQYDLSINSIGGDFDLGSLLWGQTYLNHNSPLTNFDIYHLPFPDNSFPLVVCLEVLEHIPDSRAGLRELARVSFRYILLSVPHEPFFRGANFLRGKHLQTFGNDPEHLHNYSACSFQEMVSSMFDIVWHGYAFPWQIALARKRGRCSSS